jgi:hypothetical protein
MSNDAHDASKEQPSQPDKRQGPPPTPFDHPLFLPVLLFAGMIWFGYRGYGEWKDEQTARDAGNAGADRHS